MEDNKYIIMLRNIETNKLIEWDKSIAENLGVRLEFYQHKLKSYGAKQMAFIDQLHFETKESISRAKKWIESILMSRTFKRGL
jgi:hypothetical protein